MDTIFLKQQLRSIVNNLATVKGIERTASIIHAQATAEVTLEHFDKHPEQVIFDIDTYQEWARSGLQGRYVQYLCRQQGHEIEVHDTVGICTRCYQAGKELQDNV